MSVALKNGVVANGEAAVLNGSSQVVLYDQSGRPITRLNGEQVDATQRGVMVSGKNDNNARHLRVDRFGNAGLNQHLNLFHEDWEGTTLHQGRWNTFVAGFTGTQGQGFYTLTGNTTTSQVYILSSATRAPLMQRAPVQVKQRIRLSNTSNAAFPVNAFADFGLSNITTNSPINNGFYFQLTTAGVFQVVWSYNSTGPGTDVAQAVVLVGTATPFFPDPTKSYIYDILLDDDNVVFTVQDASTGNVIAENTLFFAGTGFKRSLESHLSFFQRLGNSATAPGTAPQMIIGDIYAALLDTQLNTPAPHVYASLGRTSASQPLTGVQLGNYANNTTPTNATLTNAAAAYANLGGLFSFTATAGGVSDYNLFCPPSFGYDLFITDVQIDTWVNGATSATTPTLLHWLICENTTAIINTGTQVREHLGAQSIPIGTAPGGQADRSITRTLITPFRVAAGRFLILGLRTPVGTATASQLIQGGINLRGYWR